MLRARVFVLLGLAFAVFFVTAVPGFAAPDTDVHKSCNYCGMSRDQFSHSRMLITYSDGSEAAFCSLHCAAVDLAVNLDKSPKSIQVADYGTKTLIDAEQATWVVGGSKPGVMSKRAKWAFAEKPGAEAFMKANGGQPATFEEAIKAAYEDMYGDTKMIRDKRKAMKLRLSMEKEQGAPHSH